MTTTSGMLIVPYAMPIYQAPGVPSIGATLTIKDTGTSTLSSLYSDPALTIPITNPQVSDMNGQFFAQSTTIWANNTIAYDCYLSLPNGQEWVESNVPTVSLPVNTSGFLQNPNVSLTGAPTAPTPAASDNSSKIATTAFVENALSSFVVLNAAVIPSRVTGCVGLNTSASSQNSTWSITSATLASTTSGNNPISLTGFSGTLYLTGSNGLNGLDAGGLVASTWYWVWLVSDGTTPGLLASTSDTAPTLPSGYSYQVLLGVLKTDASKNTIAFMQSGTDWDYITPSQQLVTSASTGGSWTQYSITSYVPPAYATRVRGTLWNNNNTINAAVAPINPTTFGKGYSWVQGGSNGGADNFALQYDLPLVTQAIWYASNSGNNALYITGFKLNI